MDSPLSGHKDTILLLIETLELTITIKGKPIHPSAGALHGENPKERAKLNIVSRDKFQAQVYDPEHIKGLSSYTPGEKVFPCFYENQNYQIVIEGSEEHKLKFFHENKYLRESVNYVGSKEKVLSGNLNFKNDIGFSKFEILDKGQTLLEVELEVFPAKIDYREDFYNLLREVNEEIYNLAFDFLKRTYFTAGLKKSQNQSLTEFYSILKIIFEKFIKALERIERYPHHKIIDDYKVIRGEKVKRTDRNTAKWLRKNPRYLETNDQGRGIKINGQHYWPAKMQERKKDLTYDTFENRYIKWVIKRVLNKIKLFITRYRELYRNTERYDEGFLNVIYKMEDRLRRFLQSPFIREAGDLKHTESLSLVLQMAPGYREVFKYFLMLSKGLSIQENVTKISVKNLAELYEYWCFLKINSFLKQKYHLTKTDLIKVKSDGLTVNLDKSKSAAVHYLHPQTEEKFSLMYNTMASDYNPPTTGQQPDTMLTLEKEDSEIIYRYILDAKYRLNPALPDSYYASKYKKPGPEEDDINTMHRYRDAIVHKAKQEGNFERTVFGAYVLFPLSDKFDYAGKRGEKPHKFYNSIKEVNIGGFPFSPGNTELVEEFLDDLILDSASSAFERNIFPWGFDEYYKKNFVTTNVLVGSLSSKEQLEVSLKNKFYHIPFKNIRKRLGDFQYVAVFQSGKKFSREEAGIRYYGEIADKEIVKRSEITELPKNSDELYVRFSIKKWMELKEPVKPAGYGVLSQIYTTLYLLNKAKELPELSLKSPAEMRLWQDLRRFGKEIRIDLEDKNITDNTKPRVLYLGDVTIKFLSLNEIEISNNDESIEVSFLKLKSKPKEIFNLVREMM